MSAFTPEQRDEIRALILDAMLEYQYSARPAQFQLPWTRPHHGHDYMPYDQRDHYFQPFDHPVPIR
jgi:hypothetical protein